MRLDSSPLTKLAFLRRHHDIAQENTAELRGRVVDTQDAGILASRSSSGIRRPASIDRASAMGTVISHGHHPGVHTLEAELSGFAKQPSGRPPDLDGRRPWRWSSPGAVTETITVTAETPLVDVTSKEIGGNVTNREGTSLPSVNGNVIGMVALLPGVIANVSTESFGSDAVSANGLDSRNNNFMLDGANNNDDVIGQRAGSQARMPVGPCRVPGRHQSVRRRVRPHDRRHHQRHQQAGHQPAAWRRRGAVAGRLDDEPRFLREAERPHQAEHVAPDLPRQPGRPDHPRQGPRLLQHRTGDGRPRDTITIPPTARRGSCVEHPGPVRPPVEREQHVGRPLAARVVAQLNQIIPGVQQQSDHGHVSGDQNASREIDVDQTVVATLNSVMGAIASTRSA
jgi:hypothetical protein